MNLTIRKMREDDLEVLYALLSDPRVMRYLESPYSKEKTACFLKNAGLSDPPLIYAVENGSDFVGYVIFHPYDAASMEIGWVLHPLYWGKGIASYLTEFLMKKGLCTHHQLVIECSPAQETTKHIALKQGFVYEGVTDGLAVFRYKG